MTLYHVSPKAYAERIGAEGLRADPPQRDYPEAVPGVYLWQSRAEAEWWGTPVHDVIWAVDGDELDLTLDEQMPEAFICPVSIPRERIRLMDCAWV